MTPLEINSIAHSCCVKPFGVTYPFPLQLPQVLYLKFGGNGGLSKAFTSYLILPLPSQMLQMRVSDLSLDILFTSLLLSSSPLPKIKASINEETASVTCFTTVLF